MSRIRYGNVSALTEYMIEGNRVSRIESLILFGVQNLPEAIKAVKKKRIYSALLNSSSEEVVNFDNVLNKIINE